MGVMPEDRMRRWQKLFRRYGIPDETPGTMEKDEKRDAPRHDLKEDAARVLFPTTDPRKKRKK